MWQPLHFEMAAGFAADDETEPFIKPRRAIVAGDVQPHGYTDAQVTGPDSGAAGVATRRAVALERFLPGFEAPLRDPVSSRGA